jgi:hypothetical protein
MPVAIASSGRRIVTGLPSKVIVPAVAGSMPKRARPMSVRPAPAA